MSDYLFNGILWYCAIGMTWAYLLTKFIQSEKGRKHIPNKYLETMTNAIEAAPFRIMAWLALTWLPTVMAGLENAIKRKMK